MSGESLYGIHRFLRTYMPITPDTVDFQNTDTYTPPASTNVAIDRVAGIEIQGVKLILGGEAEADAWVDSGQQARANSLPVVLSVEDAALLADLLTNTGFQARIPTNGQKTMAGSFPVVIASDQSGLLVTGPVEVVNDIGNPLPISGSVTANLGTIAGASTEATAADILAKLIAAPATEAKQDTANTALAAIDAGIPAALGATTAANSMPVTLATDGQFVSSTGSLTETAPATDTASSGLNGRLQRIAQRITSLIALVPAALGQGTMAQGFRVVLPSDQSAIPVSQSAAPWGTKELRAATPTQSSVAASASSVSLLVANANRLGATIFNDSAALLYLKLGATASTTSHTVQMQPASYYEAPYSYTGAIDGIWASATGSARITEVAA